jgi:hypothetical protein
VKVVDCLSATDLKLRKMGEQNLLFERGEPLADAVALARREWKIRVRMPVHRVLGQKPFLDVRVLVCFLSKKNF